MFDDPTYLIKLANTRMPFGKYAGILLIDLPEPYVVWFKEKGWPEGEIGNQLASLYVIKENGLESLIRPLVRSSLSHDTYGTPWKEGSSPSR